MIYMTKEQRKARDLDFAARERPRLLWASGSEGTAIRRADGKGYKHAPYIKPKSGTQNLTEAEDNADGRALRRRTNKKLRGWRPHAKR